MITIDYVSKKRKSSALNYDKMTERYVASSNSMIIPSPDMKTIEKNFYFLLQHSEEKLFDKKYIMKPSYLSYDEYKTVALSNLLMFVNGIKSLEDFDMDTVLIPNIEAIIYISNDIFPDKKPSKLTKINW